MTRTETQTPEWMVRWTAPQGAAIGGLGSVLVLLGTVPATGALDAILVGFAIVIGGATGWFVVRRKQLDHLPLQLAPVAIIDELHGSRTLKIRAWLGLGRVMRAPSLSVLWRSDSGSERPLAGRFPAEVLCGPVTVLVPLPAEVQGGQFEVSFEVAEGERQWREQAVYPVAAVQRGRFAAPLVCRRGRWVWNRAGWDAVVASGSAEDDAVA